MKIKTLVTEDHGHMKTVNSPNVFRRKSRSCADVFQNKFAGGSPKILIYRPLIRRSDETQHPKKWKKTARAGHRKKTRAETTRACRGVTAPDAGKDELAKRGGAGSGVGERGRNRKTPQGERKRVCQGQPNFPSLCLKGSVVRLLNDLDCLDTASYVPVCVLENQRLLRLIRKMTIFAQNIQFSSNRLGSAGGWYEGRGTLR